MRLIRYTPRAASPFVGLDRWFDEFFAPDPAAESPASWSPPVDVFEEAGEFVLKADLPEVDEKNLKVEVDDGVLTVEAERNFDNASENDGYRRIERAYGSFKRNFVLPDNVNADGIKAAYDKGVLKVTLPKTEPKKTVRRIAIH